MTTPQESRPRRLGRGLSSLLGQAVEVSGGTSKEASTSSNEQNTNNVPAGPAIVRISIGSIAPGRFQPRKKFDEHALQTLSESIKIAGVMQPVLVRPAAAGAPGATITYELVAGERRWRAASMAGLVEIPAVVVQLTDADAAQWGLIENLQREDLGTMERAQALAALAREFGLVHAQIAERVGLDRSTVTNLIRLTELEASITSLIDGGRLSAGHGKALLGVAPGLQRVKLAEKAALGGWSVRRLEQVAVAAASDEGSGGAPELSALSSDELIKARARDLTIREIERRLQEHLGTKVSIKTDRSGTRGRVTLRFYGLDQFEGLLARIGVPAGGN